VEEVGDVVNVEVVVDAADEDAAALLDGPKPPVVAVPPPTTLAEDAVVEAVFEDGVDVLEVNPVEEEEVGDVVDAGALVGAADADATMAVRT
jgi:hypothetical protein